MVDDTHSKIKKIKEYAKENDVPIMQDKGIDFLTTFILKNQVDTVLEIGTAIGYSAIVMALVNPKLKVVTIEKDEERYMEALKNIKDFNLENRITLIYKDALEANINEKFDLIFLDGAKGKNIDFFKRFIPNLEKDGHVITDNIKFHGYVDKDESEIKSRNLRGLVRKIKEYINFLKDLPNYSTEFYDVGDGISITSKKEG